MKFGLRQAFPAAALVAAAGVAAVAIAAGDDPQPVSRADKARTAVFYPVRERRLSSSLAVTGTYSEGREQRIPLPCLDKGGTITALRGTSGQRLTVGAPLVDVDGQPVVALPGTFPMYRDLAATDTGDDVDQLVGQLGTGGAALGQAGVESAKRTVAAAGGRPSKSKRVSQCWFAVVPPGSRFARIGGGDVGGEMAEATIVVTTGRPFLKIELAALPPAWLETGSRFEARVSGRTVQGRVTRVSTSSDTTKLTVQLERDSPRLPARTEVRGSVRQASKSKRGLVVPVASLFATTDGRSYVEVETGAGTRRVFVEPDSSDGGWTQVSPVDAAALNDGDRVAVSQR